MSQRQVILIVLILGVVVAGFLAWPRRAVQPPAAPLVASARAQHPQLPPWGNVPVTHAAAVTSSSSSSSVPVRPTPLPPSDASQSSSYVPSGPPPSVDTWEPPERKFAHGAVSSSSSEGQ